MLIIPSLTARHQSQFHSRNLRTVVKSVSATLHRHSRCVRRNDQVIHEFQVSRWLFTCKVHKKINKCWCFILYLTYCGQVGVLYHFQGSVSYNNLRNMGLDYQGIGVRVPEGKRSVPRFQSVLTGWGAASRLALEPTQGLYHWWWTGRRVKVSSYLQPMLRLTSSRAIPPVPHTSSQCAQRQLYIISGAHPRRTVGCFLRGKAVKAWSPFSRQVKNAWRVTSITPRGSICRVMALN